MLQAEKSSKKLPTKTRQHFIPKFDNSDNQIGHNKTHFRTLEF